MPVADTSHGTSGVAERYASSLFELALEAGAVEAVQVELDKFGALLDESDDLKRLVASPVFSAEDQFKAIAAICEKAGISEEDVSPPATVKDVQGLIEWLRARDAGHAEALADLSVVRVAVNQEYVQLDHPVDSGDEIAMFPPVTGG